MVGSKSNSVSIPSKSSQTATNRHHRRLHKHKQHTVQPDSSVIPVDAEASPTPKTDTLTNSVSIADTAKAN